MQIGIVVWMKMGIKYCRKYAKTKRRFDWFQIVLSVDIFNCLSWAKKTPLNVLSLKNDSRKISLEFFRVTQRVVSHIPQLGDASASPVRDVVISHRRCTLIYVWCTHPSSKMRDLLERCVSPAREVTSPAGDDHVSWEMRMHPWSAGYVTLLWVSDFLCSMFHCTSSLSLC